MVLLNEVLDGAMPSHGLGFDYLGHEVVVDFLGDDAPWLFFVE